MKPFVKPEVRVLRFVSDIIATSQTQEVKFSVSVDSHWDGQIWEEEL